jgi:hypothetical protein
VVTGLAFAPGGRTVASCSVDRTVKVWDVATGREVATLPVQSSNEARAAGAFNPRETPPPKDPSADETATMKPPPMSQAPPPVAPAAGGAPRPTGRAVPGPADCSEAGGSAAGSRRAVPAAPRSGVPTGRGHGARLE